MKHVLEGVLITLEVAIGRDENKEENALRARHGDQHLVDGGDTVVHPDYDPRKISLGENRKRDGSRHIDAHCHTGEDDKDDGLGVNGAPVAVAGLVPVYLVNAPEAVVAKYKGASRDAREIGKALGARVIAEAVSPDGRNINDGVGALHPERLGIRVRETGADLGVALDGDADRLMIADVCCA